MKRQEDAIRSIKPLGFAWETSDPFLFCVHHLDRYPAGNAQLGPAASLAGRDLGQDFAGKDGWRMYHGDVVPGFPQHPHRGFETVTIVRQGLVDHSDSLGAVARFGAGDVQWLTAGAGIVHSEMFPLLRRDRENPAELFQIWLNLPREDKLTAPHFSMLWQHSIPKATRTDGQGRTTELTVIAGQLEDLVPPSPPPHSWAARGDSEVGIWVIKLSAQAQWTLPAAKVGTQRTLFLFDGEGLRIGERVIPGRSGVAVQPDVALTLTAGAGACEVLVLQGKPIGEPVVQHGPFVMNSRAEIQQAFVDYQRTRFGGWPWGSDGPVHAVTEGRFCRHADGTIERPE